MMMVEIRCISVMDVEMMMVMLITVVSLLVSTLPKSEEVLIPIAGVKTNEHDGVANDLITRRFIAGLIGLARLLLLCNGTVPCPDQAV